MQINNVLHRGLAIAAMLALLLSTVFLATTTASPPSPVRPLLFPTDNNAGWEEVGTGSASGGGISDNDESSEYPSLAIGPDGTPYVAWEDWSNWNAEVYVRRWNGVSWEEVGTNSAIGGGISNNYDEGAYAPSVAVAPNGTPYVAWGNRDDSFGSDIYVRCWNGNTWEEVGAHSASGKGISNTDSNSFFPSLAIAPNGMPYIAWFEWQAGDIAEIYVRRWNGSSWEEVGVGSASGGGISNNGGWSSSPSLAIAPNGTPYVAWTWQEDIDTDDPEIYVRRWNGNSWEEVVAGSASGRGISNTGGNSKDPSLAIAPDGTPYVAWTYSSDPSQIYIRRWNGSVWEEVGSGSASGGGISNNSGNSKDPSLAIAPDGTPYVAWSDWQIYVRRWNGSAWEEINTGSASEGGISNSNGGALYPSIAIASDSTPYVAWDNLSGWDYQIYVRRWVGLPALEATPTGLAFLVEIGAANPSPRHIGITNGGTGDVITWTATISPTVPWLDITPTSGTTPATITATVDVSGFSTIIVETQIIIDSGEGVLDSPQTIPVRLIVAGEIYDVYLPAIFKNY